MSEKSATTCAVLHRRFKLRVPPAVLLAHSREAAAVIASVEGLIWKIWVFEEEDLEMGGMYLFANRETAEAYLNHPVIQSVRSNPCCSIHPVSAMGCREFPLGSHAGSSAGYLRAIFGNGRFGGRRCVMPIREDMQQRIRAVRRSGGDRSRSRHGWCHDQPWAQARSLPGHGREWSHQFG
jgi:Putative mono-oxygenase ydhR